MNKVNQLQKKIMRRIYYAFAMRIATHTLTVHMSLFCLALFVFAKMVHVSSVIDNMLVTELGQMPQFITGALMQGEVLTLIAIGAMIFALLSIPMHFREKIMFRVQAA